MMGPARTAPQWTRAAGVRGWRKVDGMKWRAWGHRGATLGMLACTAAAVPAQTGKSTGTVYRCPGPPVLYTDALTPKEANERGCRTLEGAPITVIQGRAPSGPRPAGSAGAVDGAARPPEARVDPQAQRARDSDSRRILEGELRREEERLAELRKEYNNGEPERQGNERNYQKYLDRVAELKNSIGRKESDIAAIKRELAKLPP
jgi:hypothetical protein